MNLVHHRPNGLPAHTRGSARCGGMTLVEVMVASCIGAIVLAGVAVLSVYALRSFTAMGNYADLEAKSRVALNKITREVRQATGVVGFNQSGPDKWLLLTNALEGTRFKYIWDGDAEVRALFCEKGETESKYLPECDEWSFTLYQRSPIPGLTNQFYPTTNAATCKMIEMTWKCSRTFFGKNRTTESPQSARIVLRTNP